MLAVALSTQLVSFSFSYHPHLIFSYHKCIVISSKKQVLIFSAFCEASLNNDVLMQTCSWEGLCQKAQEVFKEMEQDGHKPDVYAYNALMEAYR
jgi:pentatricopeptide repeat protein